MLQLLFIFAILSVHATELARYRKLAPVSYLQRFKFSKDIVVYEKRSNFFDVERDYRIGIMKPIGDEASARETETILQKIRATDNYLRKSNLSFNQLTGDPLHRPHWLIDEFRLTDNSVLDKNLSLVFSGLQKKDWQLDEGVELTQDLKQMRIYKNGKAGRYQTVPAGVCKAFESTTQCVIEPHGVIYVR